jgi:flavin-dependent dehydrogenase
MSALTSLRDRYDLVVVGARVAGAATAMLAARQGLRVLTVDRGRYGSDTLSTLALMRTGVLQLSRWGLLDRVRAAGTPAVRRTTFHYAEDPVPVEIRPKDGVDALYAPRRKRLDALLVDAAREAGAEVVHGVRATRLLRDATGRIQGAELEGGDGQLRAVRAAIVVGADGVRSRVAHEVGARVERISRNASGIVYGFWGGLEADGYHWHYAPGVSVGVIPTDDGATCVFVATSERRFQDEIRRDIATGYRRLLEEASPALAARVARAQKLESLHGFPGERGFLRRAHGPGWALVGDAGYFKDPITAHGISDALRDAELLARAITTGTERAFADYQAERDRLSAELFAVTDEIAGYDWSLDRVRELHRALSDSMKPELATLLALAPEPEPAARRSA